MINNTTCEIETKLYIGQGLDWRILSLRVRIHSGPLLREFRQSLMNWCRLQDFIFSFKRPRARDLPPSPNSNLVRIYGLYNETNPIIMIIPGAALPYLTRHCAFVQIGTVTFCRTAGCGPSKSNEKTMF